MDTPTNMLIPFESLVKKYGKPKGVLHVGASKGQEAAEYHRLGIDRMIFIEALPDVFLELKEHISKYPNATAIQACVSDVDGKEVIFKRTNNEGQSSSILDLHTHKTAHPDVVVTEEIPMITTRLDTLLSNFDLSGIDMLNIDLQGAELLALRGLGDLLKKFKYAYLEVNEKELYKGCPLLPDMDLFMTANQFNRVETKMFNHWGWGDSYYIRGSFRHA